MIKIDSLIGKMIDFEERTYLFVKEKLSSGIVFELNDQQLKLVLKPGTNTCQVNELLANSFLSMHMDLSNLRSKIFSPFYYCVLFEDDLVQHSFIGSTLRIKLIKSGLKRNIAENSSKMLNTEIYLKQIKIGFENSVNSLNKSITKRDAEFLIRVGLIRPENFTLLPHKTSKGILVDIDIESIKEDFNFRYEGNDLWPVNFSSVQEYSFFYNQTRHCVLDKMPEYFDRYEEMEKINQEFWAQDKIIYSKYMKMIDKYGP